VATYGDKACCSDNVTANINISRDPDTGDAVLALTAYSSDSGCSVGGEGTESVEGVDGAATCIKKVRRVSRSACAWVAHAGVFVCVYLRVCVRACDPATRLFVVRRVAWSTLLVRHSCVEWLCR
jgi:hypothetical protein